MRAKRKFKYPNLREKAGSQYIWYEFQISGHPKPYRGSTETCNERQAYLFMQAVRAEKAKGPKRDEYVSMEDLRDWDLERAAAQGVKTIDTVKHHWCFILAYFKDPLLIDHDTLNAYVTFRKSKPIGNGRVAANQTIMRELAALKRGWKQAKIRKKGKHLDWEDIWPTLKEDSKHVSQRARKWRSEEDMAFLVRFLNDLQGEAQWELLLCALTGLRFEELHRCARDSVYTVNGVTLVRVPEGKKRSNKRTEPREVALTPWMRWIWNMCIPTSGSQHRSTRRGAAKRQGFADYMHPPHCRDMRGLFSKVAMRSGVDSRIIDMAMGHGHGVPEIYAEQPEQALLQIAQCVEAYWRPKLCVSPGTKTRTGQRTVVRKGL